jgi:hypothetical protein
VWRWVVAASQGEAPWRGHLRPRGLAKMSPCGPPLRASFHRRGSVRRWRWRRRGSRGRLLFDLRLEPSNSAAHTLGMVSGLLANDQLLVRPGLYFDNRLLVPFMELILPFRDLASFFARGCGAPLDDQAFVTQRYLFFEGLLDHVRSDVVDPIRGPGGDFRLLSRERDDLLSFFWCCRCGSTTGLFGPPV